MRYSNSIVNANSDAVWNSLHKLYSLPTPSTYGTLHSYTITGLKSNSEYYVYIKAIKVNNGVRYVSQASDPVYFRTKSDIIQEGYSKIDLHQPCLLNSLYLYSVQSSSGTFRIFYKTELSSP